MLVLPDGEATPLIRTDFSDEAAWLQVLMAVQQPSAEGFRANLVLVDDRAFDGANPGQLAQLAKQTTEHGLLVLADILTMIDAEHTLYCIDPTAPGGEFRCAPEHLWGVENNISVANMDFSEYASSTDADGVFRGFRD